MFFLPFGHTRIPEREEDKEQSTPNHQKNGGPLSPPKKKTYCKSHVKYCQIIASDCCFHFSS